MINSMSMTIPNSIVEFGIEFEFDIEFIIDI